MKKPPPPIDDVDASGVPGTRVDLTAQRTAQRESSSPALPNERDERVGATGGVQSTRIRQGARDLKQGLVDTSRAPEADAAYQKLKR